MACYDFLDRLGVSYGRVDHSPAFHIETCHQVEAVLEAPIAKNLFLCNRQKTQSIFAAGRGQGIKTSIFPLSWAQPPELCRGRGSGPASGSSARLRQPSVPAPGPGCAVQLVLDRPLLRQAYLGLHPCQNTSTLRIAMGDVLERVIPALGHRPLLVDLPEDPL